MNLSLLWQTLRDVSISKRWYHVGKILLAWAYLKCYPNIKIVGIAGSVGKTTTKEAIAAVLKQTYKVKYSHANIDPIFNIPSTILSLRPGDQMLIIELSIDHPGDMDCYLQIARPHVGVLTKISLEHSEFLGSLESIAYEEAGLLRGLPKQGLAVVNGDDEACRALSSQSPAPVKFFGWDNAIPTHALNYQDQENGSTFKIVHDGQSIDVNWSLVGKHSANAAVAALLVGQYYDLSLNQITQGLTSMPVVPHRLNVYHYNGTTILDDAYNASPAAVSAALGYLKDKVELKRAPDSMNWGGRAIAVLATMKELGDFAEAGHRDVGRVVAQTNPDILILWNEHTQFIADEAIKNGFDEKKIITAKSYEEILNWLKEHVRAQDIVLVKGSKHHIHLERIALALQGKDTNIHCHKCPECI